MSEAVKPSAPLKSVGLSDKDIKIREVYYLKEEGKTTEKLAPVTIGVAVGRRRESLNIASIATRRALFIKKHGSEFAKQVYEISDEQLAAIDKLSQKEVLALYRR